MRKDVAMPYIFPAKVDKVVNDNNRISGRVNKSPWGFGYQRFARTANDYSFATACVASSKYGKT